MCPYLYFFSMFSRLGQSQGFEMVMKKNMFYVLNLKGHKNCMIGSKVTELMN